jgi:23S rRNA (uridine2552-2'-O)-methyltransferase
MTAASAGPTGRKLRQKRQEGQAQGLVAALDRAADQRSLCAAAKAGGHALARGLQADRDRRQAQDPEKARRGSSTSAQRLAAGAGRGQVIGSTDEDKRGGDRLSRDGPDAGVKFLQMDFLDDDAPQALIEALGGAAGRRLVRHGRAHHRPPPDRSFAHHASVRGGRRFRHRGAETRRPFPRQDLPGRHGEGPARSAEANFKIVIHVKPPSSRAESVELYILAKDFKGRGRRAVYCGRVRRRAARRAERMAGYGLAGIRRQRQERNDRQRRDRRDGEEGHVKGGDPSSPPLIDATTSSTPPASATPTAMETCCIAEVTAVACAASASELSAKVSALTDVKNSDRTSPLARTGAR